MSLGSSRGLVSFLCLPVFAVTIAACGGPGDPVDLGTDTTGEAMKGGHKGPPSPSGDAGTTQDAAQGTVDAAPAQNDMQLGGDAPNAPSVTGATPPVLSGTGYLNDGDPQDCFTFDLQPTQTISGDVQWNGAEETFSAVEYDGYVYCGSTWVLSASKSTGGGAAAANPGTLYGMSLLPDQVTQNCPGATTARPYAICINRGPGGTGAGTYHLSVTIQ